VALTLAQLNDISKEIWASNRLQALALGKSKRTFSNLVKKREVMGGKGYLVPLWWENPQSVGHSISDVLANVSSHKNEQFNVSDDDFVHMYGAVEIAGKALLGSRSEAYAVMKAKDLEMQGLMNTMGKRLHEELWGDGNGYLARGTTLTDGSGEAVYTFTNKSDVNKFGIGQVLKASANANGSSARNGEYTVTEISRSAGTITINGTAKASSSWGDTDYLFIDGDQGTTEVKVSGIPAWIPLAEPSATAFFGVDRTQHVTRFAGYRVDQPGQEIRQSLHQLCTLIDEGGMGTPNTVILHPLAGDVLADQLDSKAETLQFGKKGEMNFTGFRLNHFASGPMDFLFDYACPVDRAYALDKDSWELIHMGAYPHLIEDDGQVAVRSATADSIQIRSRAFVQLVCNNPGANGVCSISI
jgi:hypothetical protein